MSSTERVRLHRERMREKLIRVEAWIKPVNKQKFRKLVNKLR